MVPTRRPVAVYYANGHIVDVYTDTTGLAYVVV